LALLLPRDDVDADGRSMSMDDPAMLLPVAGHSGN
jgi:hypothetical protein